MDFFQNFTPWSLLAVPASLLAIMVHEVCHGLTAYALGDPTAMQMKRLSFNPIRHIDPIGLLLLIVFGFGWAKPVPVDIRYLKNPKRSMAFVALAGPISNFLLAFISVCGVRVTLLFSGLTAQIFFHFFSYMALRSTGLGIFNLLPIPPLDGSKVLGAFLPDRLYWQLMRFERYGMFVLMLLVWLNAINQPISWLMVHLLNLFYRLFSLEIPQLVQATLEGLFGRTVTPGEVFDVIKAYYIH